MYIQHALITGRGEFPVDMLRYDRCAPYTETDSYAIRNAIANAKGPWEITVCRLVAKQTQLWTVARWRSFCANIVPGRSDKVPT